MITNVLVAALAFAFGIFLASMLSLAVFARGRGPLNIRKLFSADARLPFVAAATCWSIAGLIYIAQAGAGSTSGLQGFIGLVAISGWAGALAFWFAGSRTLGGAG
jgi:hypothetical protein